MKQPIALIGVGEMGGVFSRGFLRLGHPVYPVTRGMSLEAAASSLPQPALVLAAVAEGDLHSVLTGLPKPWRDRLALLQNELLPKDWEGLPTPTVISVWFEKKRGMDHKVIIPSPIFGPQAQLLADALATLDIPTRILEDADELLFELVVKNLYILTTNIAGLRTGGTVGELWSAHQDFARRVGNEVIDLQEALAGGRFDREALFGALARAFDGDPAHRCMGRSAPARLARTLALGDAHGLALPALREIQTGS
ncbi:MAG: hypothetical protein U9Q81_11320 [Pseudomonadota bacterium]|nr:hypothetical protein [Pseudomonadota bacterium]